MGFTELFFLPSSFGRSGLCLSRNRCGPGRTGLTWGLLCRPSLPLLLSFDPKAFWFVCSVVGLHHTHKKKNEIKRLRRRKIGPPFFRAEFSRRLASNENEKGADDTKIVIKRFHSMGGSNGTTPRCDRGKRKRSTERGAKGDRTEKRGPSFIGRDISHSTPQMRCSSWRKKRKSKKKRKTKRGTEREREIR